MRQQKTFKEFISPPFLIEETEESTKKKIQEVDGNVKKQLVAAQTLENQMRRVFGKEINVVPDQDPIKGYMGFTCFFTENGKEQLVRPLVPVFDRCIEQHVGPAELEAVYDIAIENDQPVSKYDDPDKLRFGLIVTRHSKRVVYWSEYKDFYQYFKKEKEKKQGKGLYFSMSGYISKEQAKHIRKTQPELYKLAVAHYKTTGEGCSPITPGAVETDEALTKACEKRCYDREEVLKAVITNAFFERQDN